MKENPVSFNMHVRVNVATFKARSTKAMIPVESTVETVRSQRIGIHLANLVIVPN